MLRLVTLISTKSQAPSAKQIPMTEIRNIEVILLVI
jgi:hypothetical protein